MMSETENKSVFKAGDRVKIVRKCDHPVWVSGMDKLVGQCGIVRHVSENAVVYVDIDGINWCVPAYALEHADDEACTIVTPNYLDIAECQQCTTPTRIPIAWIEPATPKTRAATFADVPEEATAAVFLYKSGDRMGISHKTDWVEWDSANKQHEIIGYFVGQEWHAMSEVCGDALPASMAEADDYEAFGCDEISLTWKIDNDVFVLLADGGCMEWKLDANQIKCTKHIGTIHFDLSGIGGGG